MDFDIAVQKSIDESIYTLQDLVKKFKLGQANFAREQSKDTNSFYCFKMSFNLAKKELVFPLAIDTFGRKFMVSKRGGLHRVEFNFDNLQAEFIHELSLLNLVIPRNS